MSGRVRRWALHLAVPGNHEGPQSLVDALNDAIFLLNTLAAPDASDPAAVDAAEARLDGTLDHLIALRDGLLS